MCCAVLYFGVDDFGSIISTLGAATLDRLVAAGAGRLSAAQLRERPRGVFTRCGIGDFALVLPDPEVPENLVRLAELLLSELARPVQIDGRRFILEATAGIFVQSDAAYDPAVALRGAKRAVLDARRVNQKVQLCDPARSLAQSGRREMLTALWRALDSTDLQLHYQPQVAFDGHTVGLEALLRWGDGKRVVPPDEFIGVAENSWLMPCLTEYVIDSALGQLAQWRLLGVDVPVAVNISPRDVLSPGFAARVSDSLRRHRVPARALRLEITEHMLLDDPHQAAETLTQLRALGIGTSLDDFGTGYSSLSRLRDLPVDELKIDRLFVSGLVSDARDAALVKWSIDLAHSLGLISVAEGVEDEETWNRLRALGADVLQGWLVAPALPVGQATDWLLDHARGAGSQNFALPQEPPPTA